MDELAAEKSGIITKALKLVRYRPAHFLRTARCYLLFYCSYLLRRFFKDSSVILDENVRLQKISSLMAEKPQALIRIGRDSIIYEDTKIEAYGTGKVHIGSGSIIGGAKICCRHSVTIGQRFLASWNVFIQDYDSHPINPDERRRQMESMVNDFKPSFVSRGARASNSRFSWNFPGSSIEIGDDVWIGAGASILKGARIGSGCIIATGAVVLKGVYPDNSILAGNPAKIVKKIDHDRNHVKKQGPSLSLVSTSS